MRNKLKFLKFPLVIALLIGLTACNNDDYSNDGLSESGEYANGVVVLNEGNFGSNSASVSFIKDGIITNDVYALENNGSALGDVAQSILLEGDKAFIVVNNSNVIVVVNRYTFEKIATISSNVYNPRYAEIENGKLYVTNWGNANDATDDYVAVYNSSSYSYELSIPVGEGPENIISHNNKLYVSLKGGYNYNNKVVEINTSNNTVTNTITVGDLPGQLVEENGNLYVLCSGKAAWTGDETLASLTKINLSNLSTSAINFSSGDHPSNLVEEDNFLYYVLDNSIYRTSASATTLPSSPLFTTDASYLYGFNVEDGNIYVADASFTSASTIKIYSTSGTLLQTYSAGVGSNGFYFND